MFKSLTVAGIAVVMCDVIGAVTIRLYDTARWYNHGEPPREFQISEDGSCGDLLELSKSSPDDSFLWDDGSAQVCKLQKFAKLC